MMLTDKKADIERSLRTLNATVETINDAFIDFIDSLDSGLKESKKRNQLALNVISNKEKLLNYTPESKGMLIYLLTRHGIADHIDTDNRGNKIIPDIYSDRKDAIIIILASIQTQKEWFEVFSHCTVDGSSLSGGNPALKYMVSQKQMNNLSDFLQEGMNRDHEMETIYRRLRVTPAWGYPLAWNNSEAYRLYNGINPLYSKSAMFSPSSESLSITA